jgi:iron complex outermembrane receptor protein
MNEPIFRLGANYNPLEGTFIRASFGQALRSPGVAERFTATQAGPLVVSPNANILVEKGYSAEIGIRQLYRLGPKVDMGAGRKPRSRFEGFIDAAAFTMQFQNMVEFYADFPRIAQLAAQNKFSVVFSAQNVSNASILGGELNFMVDAQVTRKFNVLLSGGATFTDPTDVNGDPALDGDDSTKKFTNLLLEIVGRQTPTIIDDRPRVLKYRNRWLVRSSLELSYGPVTFTANYSYSSALVNVDKVFMVPFFLRDTQQFRAVNNTGWHLVDFVLGFKTAKPKGLVSAHVFNVFNTEYMTIPGTLGEQRQYALQYRIEF